MPQTTPGSDPVYKRLYACPEMVEDLLRSLFPAETLDAVDWPSLGKASRKNKCFTKAFCHLAE